MEIKDNNGLVRVKITSEKVYNGVPLFIQSLIEIRMDSMYAKELLDIEATDFAQMERSLHLLEKNQIHTFYFRPIDERFQIKFESQGTGNIQVSGFLKDKMHINKLDFSFETSPTELYTLGESIKDFRNEE